MLLNIFVTAAYADGSASQCVSLFSDREIKIEKSHQYNFKDGHNESLRSVMLRMKEFENHIREFVDGLTSKPQSSYMKDDSAKYRNANALEEVLLIAHRYEKILEHLVEHSDHMMMSPRIQSIPVEKRAQFIAMYKQSYVKYLETFRLLTLELESWAGQEPATWDNHNALDILMNLHTQMGAAHNRS